MPRLQLVITILDSLPLVLLHLLAASFFVFTFWQRQLVEQLLQVTVSTLHACIADIAQMFDTMLTDGHGVTGLRHESVLSDCIRSS